jgi:hypothetical protein
MEVTQEFDIDSLLRLSQDVVRVNQKLDEAVLLTNEGNLPFPQIERVLTQKIEKGVVLRGGQRQLEKTTIDIRKHRAASAALWLEVRDIGNRHVVLKLELSTPLLIPIHHPRAKSLCRELPTISVDGADTVPEFSLTSKQVVIMTKIVHVDFVTPTSDLGQKCMQNGVRALRNNLES